MTDDERECLDRAAVRLGQARGPFARSAALYRAGWQGYSGPLFGPGTDPRALERCQLGDVLHEHLRTLRELATTLSLLANEGCPPEPASYKLVVAHCRLVLGSGELLGAVGRFADVPELTADLEALAARLAAHNGIVANQIIDTAAAVRSAIERKVSHGKAEEQEG